MPFQINITMDANGLKTLLNAGQSITLVQPAPSIVESAVAIQTGPPVVGWLVFQPAQCNRVQWSDSYFLYAASMALQPGAVIEFDASTAAQPGFSYTFERGQLSGSPGTASSYNVFNKTQRTLTFGLALGATVNNSVAEPSPLNAASVLFNEEAFFGSVETVGIFLSSASTNGTVLPQLPESALMVTVSNENPTADVCFNENTNSFFQPVG